MSLLTHSEVRLLQSKHSKRIALCWFATLLSLLLSLYVSLKYLDEKTVVARLTETTNTMDDQLQVDNGILQLIFQEQYSRDNIQLITVNVSAYSSTKDQTDSTPHLNAAGSSTMIGQVAVSRDLINKGVAFGDIVMLVDVGVFIVTDVMAPRWKNKVDIWTSDKKAANLFGTKETTMIWISK